MPRTTNENRKVPIVIGLPAPVLAELDRLKGEKSRPQFVEQLVRAEAKRRTK